MVEVAPPNDPLESLFSGKRAWVRVDFAASIGLRGADGTYRARVLDLSRGGLLAAIEDPAFYKDAATDGLALVHARFPDGPEVCFPDDSLVRHAQIVRITPHGDGQVALGCSFASTLTDAEAVLSGLAAAEAAHPEATAATLPLEPRPKRPISSLLFAAEERLAGPFALGRVLAAGEYAVDVALDGSMNALLENLSDGSIRATLVLGRERLWEGDLRVVAYVEKDDTAARAPLRIRLVAASPWGRAVAKHMRRAASA